MTNKFRNMTSFMAQLTNIFLLSLVIIISVHQYKQLLSNYFEAKADRFYLNREYPQSLKYYRRALEHDRGSILLALKYGGLFAAGVNSAAAINHYRETSTYCFSPDIELRLGQLFFEESKYDSAISHYENVYYLSPSKLRPLYHLAKINHAAGRADRADSISIVLINTNPKVNSAEAILMKEELKSLMKARHNYSE